MEVDTSLLESERMRAPMSRADWIRILRSLPSSQLRNGESLSSQLLQAILEDGLAHVTLRRDLAKEVDHCTPRELAALRSTLLNIRASDGTK
jgi:hypothetical protein